MRKNGKRYTKKLHEVGMATQLQQKGQGKFEIHFLFPNLASDNSSYL